MVSLQGACIDGLLKSTLRKALITGPMSAMMRFRSITVTFLRLGRLRVIVLSKIVVH